MSEDIAFRQVDDSEIDLIAEMAVRAWTPIYKAYNEVLGNELFERMHPNWSVDKAEQVRNAARTRPGMVWVSELNGRIVGFATFKVDEAAGVGEIGNNAVDPEFQGRGIGKRQHREVLRLLRERGLTHAIVQTNTDDAHAAARASYEKVGFREMRGSVTYFMEL